jgi:hypothetical protein
MKMSPHGWVDHACILAPISIKLRSEIVPGPCFEGGRRQREMFEWIFEKRDTLGLFGPACSVPCKIHNQLEVAMKTRYPIALLFLLPLPNFAVTDPADAQRARRAKVQALQATSDKTGQHAATTEIPGPATITCIHEASEIPDSQPPPSCHLTAPGFRGN